MSLRVLEILAFFAVVVADAFGFVPLTQTVLLLPLVWVSLHFRHEPWSTIGFSVHPAWRNQLRLARSLGLRSRHLRYPLQRRGLAGSLVSSRTTPKLAA